MQQKSHLNVPGGTFNYKFPSTFCCYSFASTGREIYNFMDAPEVTKNVLHNPSCLKTPFLFSFFAES